MFVYRIGKTKYAENLSGEGARLNGGRWNHKLVPCIYTSESRALASLEYTVNVNIEDIPRALSITTFEIPDVDIQFLTEADLPGNWKDAPAPSSTKDFGTNKLKELTNSIIKIPSSVIPNEFNYLLNPLHPNSKLFKIVEITDFIYDVRIKMG
ncbi:MAG: RES family NAD+ phosphorylase [Segetibacter sp.]